MEGDSVDEKFPTTNFKNETTDSTHYFAMSRIPSAVDVSSCDESDSAESVEILKPPDGIKQAKKWSRSLIVLTATVLITQLLTTAGYSIISPFFPQEAKKKGLTDTQIGLIFASIEAAMFVMSPIYGSLVSQ